MRKQIDGLTSIISISRPKLILTINNPFIFCSKDKTKLKILEVDQTGVWIYYKRRHSEKFIWPREFLKDYKGYVVVDDFPGYNHIPNVTLQKCFVHARRKFTDIYIANKDPKVLEIIDLADKIFEVQRRFRDEKLSLQQKYKKEEIRKTI